MKKTLYLSDFYDSTFCFYLDDLFRAKIFAQLKAKYRNWRILARILKIDIRHLFGMRRGWELRNCEKKIYPINARLLLKIKEIVHIPDSILEKHVTFVKYGHHGVQGDIHFPLIIDSESLVISSLSGALYDHVLRKSLERIINKDLPQSLSKLNGYITLFPKITPLYLETLRRRGLKPLFKSEEECFRIEYRIPGTNLRKNALVPKRIIFDEIFAKEFGKWVGDRCGGPGKIGVANKEFIFIETFQHFLKDILKQESIDYYMTCRQGFQPPKSFSLNNIPIKYSKTQYGDYAYRVEISNSILKHLVFDVFQASQFSVLFNSKPSVRYAFYAGLFEAEGSIERKSKILSFAFGSTLPASLLCINILYRKSIELYSLLKADGFCPRISRKCTVGKKMSTLKYDVNLLTSKQHRSVGVNFIKDSFYPYINHTLKLKTFEEVYL